MGRELLLDLAEGRAAARRIVAVAGGDIGDPGAGADVDPQARAHAIGVAGMADHDPPAPEKIVVAAGGGEWKALHSEAISAVEAAVGIAVGAIEAPLRAEHGSIAEAITGNLRFE